MEYQQHTCQTATSISTTIVSIIISTEGTIHPEGRANIAAASSIASAVASSVPVSSPPQQAFVHPERLAHITAVPSAAISVFMMFCGQLS